MTIELASRRLENVSGRHAPEGTPICYFRRGERFRLRTGKTELAGIARMRHAEWSSARREALRNRSIIEPLDRGGASPGLLQAFRAHELDRSGAVLADAGD